jgi:prevent-host-death family protein
MLVKALAILPISDLRTKSRELLARVKEEPVVITQRSRPEAVVVGYESYNEMVARLEALEDARDALIIERALAQGGEFVSFDEMIEDYEQAHGIRIDRKEIIEAAKRV